jgi:hypothetical protein
VRRRKLLGSLVLALLTLSIVPACSRTAASTKESVPSSTQAPTVSRAPAGDDAPPELQGTWRLVTRGSPERGLLFVISDRHYRVPTRLANGDLAVNGNKISFFNAAVCGLTLPEGVGRYSWAVRGDRLRFELLGKEPCGGRRDILANGVYRRIGLSRRFRSSR